MLGSYLVAGAAGSIVALRFAPGLTKLERAGNVLAGALCAAYLTPLATDWLHIESPGMVGGMAFLVGMFGQSMAAACVQAMRDMRLADIITGWISRKP